MADPNIIGGLVGSFATATFIVDILRAGIEEVVTSVTTQSDDNNLPDLPCACGEDPCICEFFN